MIIVQRKEIMRYFLSLRKPFVKLLGTRLTSALFFGIMKAQEAEIAVSMTKLYNTVLQEKE